MVNEYGEAFGPILLASYGSGFYEGVFFPFPEETLPPGRYELRVETPCNGSGGTAEFEVLLTEVDRGDSSPPELSMRATTQSGRSETVSASSSVTASLDAFLDETISVFVEAKDRQGLSAVRVDAPGGRVSGQSRFNASGTPPIPTRKTLSLLVTDLPRPTMLLEAAADNFNRFSPPVRTPQIVVNVLQRQPILTRLSPTRATVRDALDLFGNHFKVSQEPTLVRFKRAGSVAAEVSVPSRGLTNSKLSGVNIPNSLANGRYDVSVVVGLAMLESNVLPFEVFTREPAPAPEPDLKRYQLILSHVAGTTIYRANITPFTYGFGFKHWKIRSIDVKTAAAGQLAHDTGTVSRFGSLQTNITAFTGERTIGIWEAVVIAAGGNRAPASLWFEVEGEVP